MIIIVNCQACGKQLFRDQDYEPKGHGVQLLVPPCDCAAQQSVQSDGSDAPQIVVGFVDRIIQEKISGAKRRR